jgi:hypothetical protein
MELATAPRHSGQDRLPRGLKPGLIVADDVFDAAYTADD